MENVIAKGKHGGWRPNSGRKPGFVGYWTGKKRSEETKEKLREKGKLNPPNKDYFKNHKFVGINHANWKGDKVGYYALHTWVQRTLGKPETCEHCGKTGLKGRAIQWANKSGKYKRKVTDWLRLCTKCHYNYDRK